MACLTAAAIIGEVGADVGIGALATDAVAGGVASGFAGVGAGTAITAADLAGGLTGLSGGALGAATALGGGSADIAGLTQMGQDAGLSGQQLQDFVNSGGTTGSTAAGGGGVGFGADTFAPGTAAHVGGTAAEAASGIHSGSSFGLDTFKSALQFASPLSSIYSGISGMEQADRLKKQAAIARSSGNPWAASGGQGVANQQLMDLMANPGMVASNDPAYKLRIQGAQRATAQQGQGSGAMAVAGANASTDWYNARLQQLGGLAGAPGNPVGTAQLGLSGDIAAGDLMSKSQGSIGFGVNSLTGGGAMAAMPPNVRQWLQQAGYLGA